MASLVFIGAGNWVVTWIGDSNNVLETDGTLMGLRRIRVRENGGTDWEVGPCLSLRYLVTLFREILVGVKLLTTRVGLITFWIKPQKNNREGLLESITVKLVAGFLEGIPCSMGKTIGTVTVKFWWLHSYRKFPPSDQNHWNLKLWINMFCLPVERRISQLRFASCLKELKFPFCCG